MRKLNFLNVALLSISLLFSGQLFANVTTAISDTEITATVKSKIALDHKLARLPVSVKTNHGVVDLSGTVNSEVDASELVELVQSVNGVRDVETRHLMVKNSRHPLADSMITAKVKGLFVKEKIFSDKTVAATIHVETVDGVVYLSGKTDNQRQIDNAVSLTKTVKGVKKVDARLEVKS